MRCQHCNYQIFAYSRCCPNCGKVVQIQVVSQTGIKAPKTRFDFWVAGLRRQLHLTPVRRTAA
jgi:hypothetical protein